MSAADGKLRFWRNTTMGLITGGTTATLPTGTLGFRVGRGILITEPAPAGTFNTFLFTTQTLTADLLLEAEVELRRASNA